jgi:hypothetical protein
LTWPPPHIPHYIRAVRGGQGRLFEYSISIGDETITNLNSEIIRALVINGDETITDLNTGLMWQRQSFNDTLNWKKALSNCENLSFAGYSDWRLPTNKELISIVNYLRRNPATNKNFFPDAMPAPYWSSTTWGNYACSIDFSNGSANMTDDKKMAFYVRAVRGGQNRIFDSLIILSPNQGSIWNHGDNISITWETLDIPGKVNILISRQGGREGSFEIIAENIDNDGIYTWKATGKSSVNCVLKIEPVNEPSKSTVQGMFTIRAPCFFTSIPDIYFEDIPEYKLEFTVIPPENDYYIESLIVTSSNTDLIANENIHLKGEGLDYTLTFFPDEGNQFGSTTISIEMKGSCESTDDFVLTILPVNNPPLIHLSDSPFYTKENTTLAMSDIDNSWIIITDGYVANQPIQLTMCAINGFLSLTQTTFISLTSGSFINTEMMSFSGTLERINNALKNLVFIPSIDFFGHAYITIMTSDKGYITDGGRTNINVLNINIIPDPPLTITTAYSIPDSGLTQCCGNKEQNTCPQPGEDFYGQDAIYTINKQSFTKLDLTGNDLPDSSENWSMVRDNVTGLIWEIKTNDGSIHDKDNTYKWYDSNPYTNGGDPGFSGNGTDTEDFIAQLNTDKFGGYSDWRLPSIKELDSISYLGNLKSSIDRKFFANTNIEKNYWSSTSYLNSDRAWIISFLIDGYSISKKATYNYVRAVRGGQKRLFENLVVNGDDTVTDVNTGLLWQQKGSSYQMDWQTALSDCENLSFAGYNDWRLPTKKELQSIVSYEDYNPAIKKDFFFQTHGNYWSSTPIPVLKCFVFPWCVEFNYGSTQFPSNSAFIRAVRGGQCQLTKHFFIQTPKQGSIWKTTDIIPITWDTKDISGSVNISISYQGGKPETFVTIIQNTENDGSFDWQEIKQASVNCMLKIESINDLSKSTMNGLFTLSNPKISSISNCRTEEDKPLTITFTVRSLSPVTSTVRATTSNPLIVPDSHLFFSRSNDSTVTLQTDQNVDYTLIIFPMPNVWGTSTITIYSKNSKGERESTTFQLEVIKVNDPPVNFVTEPFELYEDTLVEFSEYSISITDIDAGINPISVYLSSNGGVFNNTNLSIIQLTGTVDEINSKLSLLTFTPFLNRVDPVRITLTTMDNGSSGLGGNQSDTDFIDITIIPINDAPTIIAPESITIIEDNPITFSQQNNTQIVVDDVDAATNNLKFELTTSSGRFKINGDVKEVFTSDLQNITNFLEQLTFIPSQNFNGIATVTLTVNDNGHSGFGGPRTASKTIRIVINAVNDAPLLSPFSPYLTEITEDENDSTGELIKNIFGNSIFDGDNNKIGIAITKCFGNNQWQYFDKIINSWSKIPTLENDTAFLLRHDDKLRYKPDTKNGEIAYLQYFAWDQTSGTAYRSIDVSKRGDETAFSEKSDTLSITVIHLNDSPEFAPDIEMLSITEDQNNNPGELIADLLRYQYIADPDFNALTGMAIICYSTNKWQYLLSQTDQWIDFPDFSNDNALLLGAQDYIRFVPDTENGENAFFEFHSWDQIYGNIGEMSSVLNRGDQTGFSESSGTVSIEIQSINDAPTLSPSQPPMLTINEDETKPNGVAIKDILSNEINDVDKYYQKGIAIFSVMGNGTWEYQYNSLSPWVYIESVSQTQSIPLDLQTKIRYIPDQKNGEIAFFDFCAWDQTQSGKTVDTTLRGGTTAFSQYTDTISIVVTDVNDSPQLNNSLYKNLSSITEDNINNSGYAVSDIAKNFISDSDNSALTGIAIIECTGNNKWQYFQSEWLDIENVSESNAYLLTPENRIRYVPDEKNGETVTFTFCAWDQTSFKGQVIADIREYDAFSLKSDYRTIEVKPVNDQPKLVPSSPKLNEITEDEKNDGQRISSIINGTIEDCDDNAKSGIAVAYLTGNGSWEYFNNGIWISIIIDPSYVLLLGEDISIRYVSFNENEEDATISYYAWDYDDNDEGKPIHKLSWDDQTVFSHDMDTASIHVTALNDPPKIKDNFMLYLDNIAEDTSTNNGQKIQDIIPNDYISDVDEDDSPGIKAIAVISLDNFIGQWMFSKNEGENWETFSNITKAKKVDLSTTARLLKPEYLIKFVPSENEYGDASLSFRAWDKKSGTAGEIINTTNEAYTAFSEEWAIISIYVLPVNDAPFFADIEAPSPDIFEDSPMQTIDIKDIMAGKYKEDGQTITFYYHTNNELLIKDIDIQWISEQTAQLSYTPIANAYGQATITVTAQDDGGIKNGGIDTVSKSFLVNVIPVNDQPSFNAGENQTLIEDINTEQSIEKWATNITAGENEDDQSLIFHINPISPADSLFAEGTPGMPVLDTNGTLSYKIRDNTCGSAQFSITLNDSGGIKNEGKDTSSQKTISFLVSCVNDPPSFKAGNACITVNEDSGIYTEDWATNISTGGGSDEGSQVLKFYSEPSQILLSNFNISKQGQLSFKTIDNANGETIISVYLQDDGSDKNTSSIATLKIKILPKNDTPSFSIPTYYTVNEDSGLQQCKNWATNIRRGPKNESDQTIEFITTVTAIDSQYTPFFKQEPSISEDGTLIFCTEKDVHGSATIRVVIKDNGGTANGGNDISEQTFQMIVTPMKENKVIIVFGGPNTDPRYDTFKTVADLAYNTLMSITGYTEQNTLYVQPDSQATTSTIYSGINNWARDADSLLIYFIGHGDEGKFQLNTNEYLQATILSEWLDTIQETIQGRVIFIYDSCRSGSFIPVLMHKNRVLITSSGNNEDAFFENFGKDSFSYEFWSQIAAHHYFDFAYFYAKKAISENQTAHLEADGLTTTTYKEDNIVINNLCLGENHICTKPEKTPCVVKGKDSFEPDDNTIKKARFFSNEKECHNFYNIDGSQPDEDWIMIYAPDNKKVIEILNPGENCDPVIELYDIDNLDDVPSLILDDGFAGENERHEVQGSYYMKLRNYQLLNDDTSTTYQLNIYNESGSFSGTLSGCVINPFDPGYDSSCLCHSCGTPISEITVKIIDSDNEQYLKSKYNQTVGFYYKGGLDAEKTYLLSAIANGYTIFNKKIIINQLKEERLDIYMYPVKGDLTGDCIIDLNDLILSCQEIVDGLKETNLTLRSDYVTSGVDIDNDQRVGLAEVIYIMQQLKVVE